MDEDHLIESAKNGNKTALNKLLTDNYNILKGYVIKMTGDPYISQDIIQETMLKACIKISKFKPYAKFSTWLITIATNVYRDVIRKKKPMENMYEKLIIKNITDSDNNDINNIYETKEECKAIMSILLEIPYKKRAAFILKHYYGYKYEEISKILKCPVGTVKSRINNCIKYITSEMKQRGLIDE